ncbi:hypothetical protein ACFVG1_12790 [Streptomyces bacillaris]|uniref:hypothetical protein n=1 Tax=Streptomyces bacillaris TaxID=68179 RepID=UPI0035DEF42C
MTGPEHYRKAEALLEEAASIDGPPATEVAIMAQAHAMLALAAVTAHHMVATTGNDRQEWSKAIHGPAVVCVHPEHYEGKCPCPPSCVCCGPTPATPAAPKGSPCGPVPDVCDAEAGEPCRNHEREQAHGEGEHAFCGPKCSDGSRAVSGGEGSERLALVEALVADFIDPDPCHFDHHGYCQTHGWFATDPGCPHGRAKALGLEETEEDGS